MGRRECKTEPHVVSLSLSPARSTLVSPAFLSLVVHFGSSLVSLLSLGVNLLGHNGNSQDGRMKVLIPPASRWFGLRVFTRFTPF